MTGAAAADAGGHGEDRDAWCPASKWATYPNGLARCDNCNRMIRLIGRDFTGWGRTRLARHKRSRKVLIGGGQSDG